MPGRGLWRDQQSQGRPALLASVSPVPLSCPKSTFPPVHGAKRGSALQTSSKPLPCPSPTSPLRWVLPVCRGQRVQVAPEPGFGSSLLLGHAEQGRTSVCRDRVAPTQGSYRQLPGAPARILISAGLHIVGLGCPLRGFNPPLPARSAPPQQQDPILPGHPHWGECQCPKSWHSRRVLHPGEDPTVAARRVH